MDWLGVAFIAQHIPFKTVCIVVIVSFASVAPCKKYSGGSCEMVIVKSDCAWAEQSDKNPPG